MQQLDLVPVGLKERQLAGVLVEHGSVPENASADALHIAIAAVNSVDYLLTWNCRHIANATLRPAIEAACRSIGLEAPTICTPEELLHG